LIILISIILNKNKTNTKKDKFIKSCRKIGTKKILFVCLIFTSGFGVIKNKSVLNIYITFIDIIRTNNFLIIL